MFAASRVNLSRANRKRALSASPYSDIDSLSTLIRYSPSASLQLINGAAVAAAAAAAAASASASPNSSGSYGHLSTGMQSATCNIISLCGLEGEKNCRERERGENAAGSAAERVNG